MTRITYLFFTMFIIFLASCGGESPSTEIIKPDDNKSLEIPEDNTKLLFPPQSQFTSIPTNTIEKPAYLDSFIEPEFNTTLTRITDRANQSGNAHQYPKTQMWNSDMSIIRLGYRLYHADTFKETNITKQRLIDGQMYEMKFSTKNPNIFYGINSRDASYKFVKANIAVDKIEYETLISFPKATYEEFLLGKYEGNIDFNDRYVAFATRKVGESFLTAIVYDIENNETISTKDFTDIDWVDAEGGQVLDWISVSPLGNYVLINWKAESSGQSIHQYDINLNYIRKLSDQGQHGDMGVDAEGKEVYVQFEFSGNNGIWKYTLNDGNRTRLLPDKYNGGHVSCRNYNRKGWCYLSTTAEGYREVFALKLDGSGIVERFAQTHTSGHGSQGGVSPDGSKVLFFSDWGVEGGVKDTYHVQMHSPK